MGEWPLTTPGDAGDAGLAREAAAELYAGDPAEFIQRRGALAARARASGDAVAARAIAGLRKPTRSAWVVNRLVRDDPGAAAQLAELGAGLQEAGRALDGRKLRELSRQRRELIATLTRRALASAGLRDAPVALQEEVAATLSAAVTDPAVAAELAAGALVRPVERAGFGFGAPAEAPAGTGERPVPSPAARPPASRGLAPPGTVPSASAPRANGPSRNKRNENGPSGSRPNGSSPNANGSGRPSPPRSGPCATRNRRRTRPRPRNGTGGRPAARAATGRSPGRSRGGETRVPCGRRRATGCPPGPRPARRARAPG